MRYQALIAITIAAGTAHASPLQDLDTARKAFQTKDCGVAMPYLKNVLDPIVLSDRDDIFEAHAMLGACEVQNNQVDVAKQEFRAALQLYPEKDLDPLYYSSSAVRVYDDVKADVAAEAKRAEQARELAREREEFQRKLANLRVFEVRNPYLTYVPFGVGQFNNDDTLKGGLFLGGELATAGVSLGIWYFLVNRYGLSSSNVKLEDAQTVRTLQGVEIVSGGAFFVIAAWGIIDARLHYKPQVRVQGSEELLKEDKPVEKPKKTTLHWGPIVVPGGAGIGVAWEN